MAHWGGGGMGGGGMGGRGGAWGGSGQTGPGGKVDHWNYDELGSLYDIGLIKRLFPFMAPFKLQGGVALVLMFIGALTAELSPFIIATATTSLLRGGSLATWGIVLVVLAIVTGIVQAGQRILMSWVGHRLLLHLRKLLMEHLQKLSLSFYDKEEVGRVMSRVTSDVTVMQELMTTSLLNVFSDLLRLVVIVVFLFLLDAQLAIVALAPIPVLVVAMRIWQGYARQAFINVRQAIAQVNSNINQNVSGMRVVQSLRREDINLREFNMLNEENRQSNVRVGLLQAIIMPLVEILSTVSTAAVLIVIGFRLFNGSLEAEVAIGFTLGFILYIQRFFAPVRELTMQYTMLQRAMAGAHRVFEVLDTEPEIVDDDDAIELGDVDGRVDFNHVDFSYLPGVPVLKDFDLHVEPGETVALVGHTGAGKTSVTALINRSYDIQSGSIEIDGHDLRHIKRKSLTRRMSVVLQEPYLFSGTISDNIRYGKLDATQEEIERAATAVGAHDFILRQPQGYETELHERGQNLSVGQRQLISFARAVVGEPRILILDEATANVDTQTERVIQEALKVLLSGRTSFVIAHRLSTIRDADRIIVMRNGEIVEQGTHDDLMAKDGIYADLYRMTFKKQEGVQDEIVTASTGDD